MSRAARMRLTVASMSGALSSRVPARTNSAARVNPATPLAVIPGVRLERAGQVIHVGAARQARGVAPGLVGHPADVLELQPGLAQPGAELGRPDEILVAVGA